MKSESCVHPSPELATDQSALSSHTRVAGTDSVSSDTRAPQHVRCETETLSSSSEQELLCYKESAKVSHLSWQLTQWIIQ